MVVHGMCLYSKENMTGRHRQWGRKPYMRRNFNLPIFNSCNVFKTGRCRCVYQPTIKYTCKNYRNNTHEVCSTCLNLVN